MTLLLEIKYVNGTTVYMIKQKRFLLNKTLAEFLTPAEAALFCQAVLDLQKDIEVVNEELK